MVVGGLILVPAGIVLIGAWFYHAAVPADPLAEARAALAQGRAGRAERALRAAIAADPANSEPVRYLLEVLRVEDRGLEALGAAREALRRVPPADRTAILRALTLTLLTELPDDLARAALGRWSTADPSDVEARVALLRRIGASPRPTDPDRPARLAELAEWAARRPESLNARAALIAESAAAGEPDAGRAALDAWPGAEARRDSRYWGLRGLWDLDYDRRPARAVAAFGAVLAENPADWRTRSRLARALRRAGRAAEAAAEAQAVQRIREVLDPRTLTPRLESALARLDDPAARRELAELCKRAGLVDLAAAWIEPRP